MTPYDKLIVVNKENADLIVGNWIMNRTIINKWCVEESRRLEKANQELEIFIGTTTTLAIVLTSITILWILFI